MVLNSSIKEKCKIELMSDSNKEKAKKYLLELAKKRRKGEITLEEFLHEVGFVENTFSVDLGKEFFEKVDKYAADLEGAGDFELFRYYRKEMTKEEEEKLILDNIEKLYNQSKS